MKPVLREQLTRYVATLADAIDHAEVTDATGAAMSLERGCEWVRRAAYEAHDSGHKIMFVGNGGSAGIASHLAIDYSKNGGLRSLSFNDPSALTCLANDLGYEKVFAKQIELHARPGDLLVAISSSGRSPNILAAVAAAKARECRIATYSGFSRENDLRFLGDVNFYVSAQEYGFVEIAHLTLCHAVLDMHMGWGDRPACTQ